MTDGEAAPKKRGRPSMGKRGNFTFRVTDSLRAKLEAAAKGNHLSVSEEIERRIEASFEREALIGSLISNGPDAALLRTMHKAIEKVLRMARQRAATLHPDPMQHELDTRRELHAAVEVVMHAYAATEARRPLEPGRDGAPVGEWGSGDIARLNTYYMLEWDNDPRLDDAKSTEIEAYWTGKDKAEKDEITPWTTLGTLDLSPEEAEWRRFQGPSPSETRGSRDETTATKQPTGASRAKQRANHSNSDK